MNAVLFHLGGSWRLGSVHFQLAARRACLYPAVILAAARRTRRVAGLRRRPGRDHRAGSRRGHDRLGPPGPRPAGFVSSSVTKIANSVTKPRA